MPQLDLAHSSASLNQRLSRSTAPATQEHLCALLSWLQDRAPTDYPGILRHKEASFNPRVARVAQIVIRETSERHPTTLAAAMLLAVLTDLKGEPPPEFKESWVLANSAAGLAAGQGPATTNENVVFFAYWLDRLRHAHQLPLSPIGAKDLSAVRTQLEASKEDESLTRLRTLVHAALSRVECGTEKAE